MAVEPSIKDIHFGLAAAEDERSDNPDLLLEGFVDEQGWLDQILSKQRFLILGPKGSGKSAISARIELLAEKEKRFFSKTHFLSDFPYSSFSGVLPGPDPPEIKFPNIWELILLVALADSFQQDKSSRSRGATDFGAVCAQLAEIGLLPCVHLGKLVRTATTRKGALRLRGGVVEGEAGRQDHTRRVELDPRQLLRTLQESIYRMESERDHFLFIDGLDDAVTNRDRQYGSLSSLIVAVDRVNRELKKNGAPAWIVVLCRTDLLSKLRGPNLNKIRTDRSIILDWYQDTHRPAETNLVKLAELRTRNALGGKANLWSDFLPAAIVPGEPIEKTLLNYTRHRPRDLVALLNTIKASAKSKKAYAPDVKNAIRKYSNDYFMNEVMDELDGFLETEERRLTMQLLMSMETVEFRYADVQRKVRDDPRFSAAGLESLRICTALFEASAIGNTFVPSRNSRAFYTFKFRNPAASFNPNERVVVHEGLKRALNLGRAA